MIDVKTETRYLFDGQEYETLNDVVDAQEIIVITEALREGEFDSAADDTSHRGVFTQGAYWAIRWAMNNPAEFTNLTTRHFNARHDIEEALKKETP